MYSGERTLMVITKLDLMDHGRNATNLLLRQDPILLKKPKLEIVGVVNRSYKDNETGIVWLFNEVVTNQNFQLLCVVLVFWKSQRKRNDIL